jgi:hypothetical protein
VILEIHKTKLRRTPKRWAEPELSFRHDPCDDPWSPLPPSDQSVFPFNSVRSFHMDPWAHMEASNVTKCYQLLEPLHMTVEDTFLKLRLGPPLSEGVS